MKKIPRPIYPPPVSSLADYYHPPKSSKSPKTSERVLDELIPSYAPPVPSLADYYREPATQHKSPNKKPKKSSPELNAKKNIKNKKSKKKK